ncbi:hypothetical protein CRUP_033616 [Coryphaenoides rupestris]|nr:hypothetical protein CRUP_033616 [Coryphaenoides rupestris]
MCLSSRCRPPRTEEPCRGSFRVVEHTAYRPETVRRLSSPTQEIATPPRSTSDTDLVTSYCRSTLTTSSSHYTIGQLQDINVIWDIKEDVDAGDWIGMYLIDEVLSENFLDYKSRGVNGSHKGHIVWKIEANNYFVEYFNAVGLKKGMFFNPDPYLKISIQPGKHSIFPSLPHHGQDKRSGIVYSTVNPQWNRERFSFVSLPTDVLEIEVKDKFAKSRPIFKRFLGKLSMPVQRLLEKHALGDRVVNYTLGRRLPNEQVTGQLQFRFEITSSMHPDDEDASLSAECSPARPPPASRRSSHPSRPPSASADDRRSPLRGIAAGNHASEDGEPPHRVKHRRLSRSSRQGLSDLAPGSREQEVAWRDPRTPAEDETEPGWAERRSLGGATTGSTEEEEEEKEEERAGEPASGLDCIDTGVENGDAKVNADGAGVPELPLTTVQETGEERSLHTPQSASVAMEMRGDGEEPKEEKGAEGGAMCGVGTRPQEQREETGGREGREYPGRKNSGRGETFPSRKDWRDPPGEKERRRSMGEPELEGRGEGEEEEVDEDEGMSEEGENGCPVTIRTVTRRRSRPCSLPVSKLETVIASACSEPETPRSHYIRIHQLLHALPGDPPEELLNGDDTPGEDLEGLHQDPGVASTNGHLEGREVEVEVEEGEGGAAGGPRDGPDAEERAVMEALTPGGPQTHPAPLAGQGVNGMDYEEDDCEPCCSNSCFTQRGPPVGLGQHRSGGTAFSSQEDDEEEGASGAKGQVPAEGSSSQCCGTEEPPVDTSPSSSPAPVNSQKLAALLQSPAVKFITHPEFFTVLHANYGAYRMFTNSTCLKHMILKIRRDARNFERYQHNRDLVTFVNRFSDLQLDLPGGWEMKTDPLGKASDVSRNRGLMSRPGKVAAMQGSQRLERLSCDADLVILLSLFEEDIMSFVPSSSQHGFSFSPHCSPGASPRKSPGKGTQRARAPAPYRRDFEAKLRNFYRKLEAKGYGQGPGKIKLMVRRDNLLEGTFNQVMAYSRKELQRNKLYITFIGEEGLDYSGPSREFFFLLSQELFNPYYGLFEYSANDTYTIQISPMSAFVENQLE